MTGSHAGRAAIAAAMLAATAADCGGSSGLGLDGGAGSSGSAATDGAAGTGAGGSGAGGSGSAAKTRDFDILFMVDNSSSMTFAQEQLVASFPGFMTALAGLPGGLPNVHIAVVSSNMGAGVSIDNCAGSGDSGLFQVTARAPCTATPLVGGARFLVNDNGQANYTGTIEAAFTCIANLGPNGCGFEQQLLSVSRALGADGLAPPAENQGFLRANANLVIVLITNEDDCSAQAGGASPFFSTDPNSLANPFGPVQSFRCNEFGHVCDQGAPNRNAPGGEQTAMVSYTNCVSNEQSTFLKSVSSFVQDIKRLKAAPDQQIVVAGFLGVPLGAPSGPLPYTVAWSRSPFTNSTELWPRMVSACGAAPAIFADPAVRLVQFVRAFGDNGLVSSICESDYGPALQALAQRMAQRLPP